MKKRILMMSCQDLSDEFEVCVRGIKHSRQDRKYQIIVYISKDGDVSEIVRKEVDNPSAALDALVEFKGQDFDATISRRDGDASHDTDPLIRIRKIGSEGTLTMRGIDFL
jgi:hypothetical protein